MKIDTNDIAAWYSERMSTTWDADTGIESVRFVVLDSETTGLDPRRDKLITIGAIGVLNFEIVIGDVFETMLKVAYNSASVTVHGVTRQEAREGQDEKEAVTEFLEYLEDGVIVGHHIQHDIETLNTAYERHYGFKLSNRFIDTMDLTLHLKDSGSINELNSGHELNGFSLDALCDLFGIEPHDRHTAGGDAFITALLFLRLLHCARKAGRNTLAAVTEPYDYEKLNA